MSGWVSAWGSPRLALLLKLHRLECRLYWNITFKLCGRKGSSGWGLSLFWIHLRLGKKEGLAHSLISVPSLSWHSSAVDSSISQQKIECINIVIVSHTDNTVVATGSISLYEWNRVCTVTIFVCKTMDKGFSEGYKTLLLPLWMRAHMFISQSLSVFLSLAAREILWTIIWNPSSDNIWAQSSNFTCFVLLK